MLGFLKKRGGYDFIVAFLGNPGQKYDGTRHNAGFMAAEECRKKTGAEMKKLKYRALTGETRLGDKRVLLMMPQTFMNLSGEAVGEAARYYKLLPEQIIVICDDVSLPVGKLRVRQKGSAGGHNGLKNIIACLGSDGFPRIKMGVGAPPGGGEEMIDWVLGRFEGQDKRAMEECAKRAWLAAECCVLEGVQSAMNSFNGK